MKDDPSDRGAALDALLRCPVALFPMTLLAKPHLLDSICGRACIPRYYIQYHLPVNLLFTQGYLSHLVTNTQFPLFSMTISNFTHT